MNLINSVNIQYASEAKGETLLSFTTPKTNKEAMEAAKKSIHDDTHRPVVEVKRNPPEHGANIWSAYTAHNKHLAWITLNEITVQG